MTQPSLANAEGRQDVDLSKIVEHLDVRVKLVRQLQLETPASAVASNAALGAAAIILDAIARAIEATNPDAGAS